MTAHESQPASPRAPLPAPAPGQPPHPPAPPSLADRLSGSVVGVRADITVTRHVLRGEPAYILRDPISFQSHRLSASEYRVFIALDADHTLGETFAALVEEGVLDEADSEEFYSFVTALHRMGVLTLPVNLEKSLYARFERRRAAQKRSLLFAFISFKVPLWNPADFLERTRWVARLVYSRLTFALWLAVVITAGVVAFTRREDLAAPFMTALEFENLPLLWIVLVLLKIAHEFGHAWACTRFGATVPEMGVMMILGTPCAYVDASDSWSLPRFRHRMIVNLGGMYIELFCAAIATLVWASTSAGLVNTVAYQTALLASLVTIGFNINPLAKFDGYYILTDIVGMPNLRKRAAAEITAWFDRLALGLKKPLAGGLFTSAGLCTFGVASGFYKISLTLGICAVIATRAFGLGIFLAVVVGGMAIAKAAASFIKHTLFSPDTKPVRRRAILATALTVVAPLAAAFYLPLPLGFRSDGVVGKAAESVLRAPATGFVRTVHARPGDRVQRDAPLIDLENIDLALAAASAHAIAAEQTIAERAAYAASPAEVAAARERLRHAEEASRTAAEDLARLTITAAFDAELVSAPAADTPGAFVGVGDELATLAAGPWTIRVPVDEDTLTLINPQVGDAVRCRLRVAPAKELTGRIVSIDPLGERRITDEALTQIAGGAIPVRGQDLQTAAPFFAVTIEITDPPIDAPLYGSRARVDFGVVHRPFAQTLHDRLRRFLDGLRTAS